MANPRASHIQRLRCFVAIAFDHADTDAIFQNIEDTLDKININVIRIDRVEHNDDIDDRIISEIKSADFVLADLTYARPSVYFEAGFAQRSIPVLYTVRNDHFRPRIDDPTGNLRVHFDLQMKNIIPWKGLNDDLFQKRLRSRVLKVVAPLRAKIAASEEAKVKIAAFESKSFRERRDFLLAAIRKHFARRLKYRVVELAENAPKSEAFRPLVLQRFFSGAIVGTKREGAVFRFFFFQVVPSITKGLSQEYRYGLIDYHLYGMRLFNHPQWTPTELKEDIIVCSFGASGAARLARGIPFLRRGLLEGTLESTLKAEIVHPDRTVELDRQVTVHVIESTSRLADLEQELRLRFP